MTSDDSNITSTDGACNYADSDLEIWCETDNPGVYDICDNVQKTIESENTTVIRYKIDVNEFSCPLSGTYSVSGNL